MSFRLTFILVALAAVQAAGPVRETSWNDVPGPVRQMLTSRGVTGENFRAHIAGLRQRNRIRMREGDLDHLVHYVLQSTAFTRLPPIEPAVSAKRFLSSGTVPADAKARIDAFLAAARGGRDRGPRMAIFRAMLARESADVAAEYARTMQLVAPVGAQYQERGLSTDTAIDAGYVVYLSLSALRRLEPDRRIRTVLIVGPGLDLAPRTGMVEAGAPQSYQPFAVMDALIASGLSTRDTLRVTTADINPRVTEWMMATRGTRPTLALAAGIRERDRVRLSDDYREYFSVLGQSIGSESALRGLELGRPGKSIALAAGITDALDAATVDITIERIDARYDLIVVTNVFLYLSDTDLLLAIGNIASMLVSGGVLIHNEPRPVLADALLALGVPLVQARSGIVANAEGGQPLYDAAWMHQAAFVP